MVGAGVRVAVFVGAVVAVEVLVAAVVAVGVGAVVDGEPTRKSSKRKATGALVASLLIRERSPTPPAVWSAVALSVALNCQLVGSVCPAAHTFMRSVVGLVPTAWRRTCSALLA